MFMFRATLSMWLLSTILTKPIQIKVQTLTGDITELDTEHDSTARQSRQIFLRTQDHNFYL